MLSGDWDDGGVVGDGTSDELLDVFVLLLGGTGFFDYDINLVLKNDDILKLHDFYCS